MNKTNQTKKNVEKQSKIGWYSGVDYRFFEKAIHFSSVSVHS